jgi:hypothetical protein
LYALIFGSSDFSLDQSQNAEDAFTWREISGGFENIPKVQVSLFHHVVTLVDFIHDGFISPTAPDTDITRPALLLETV